jgi:hypothetical protein
VYDYQFLFDPQLTGASSAQELPGRICQFSKETRYRLCKTISLGLMAWGIWVSPGIPGVWTSRSRFSSRPGGAFEGGSWLVRMFESGVADRFKVQISTRPRSEFRRPSGTHRPGGPYDRCSTPTTSLRLAHKGSLNTNKRQAGSLSYIGFRRVEPHVKIGFCYACPQQPRPRRHGAM